MRKLIVAILGIALIAGCATTYQKSGFTGGYKDIQLGENMFKVSFKGNGYTSSDRAADFCLLRCAELAIENGFSHFIIVDQSSYTSQSTYTTPLKSESNSTVDYFGNVKTTTTTSGGKTYNISKPRSVNLIVCFEQKPEEYPFAYEAQFLAQSIRQQYGIWQR